MELPNINPATLLGWGREEISDTYYWGGQHDIEQYLRNKGYRVISVSIGPISSSYDCAIETFYQIKGGQVDYGQTKAKDLNIIQTELLMLFIFSHILA